jgi:hypothetical protein
MLDTSVANTDSCNVVPRKKLHNPVPKPTKKQEKKKKEAELDECGIFVRCLKLQRNHKSQQATKKARSKNNSKTQEIGEIGTGAGNGGGKWPQ